MEAAFLGLIVVSLAALGKRNLPLRLLRMLLRSLDRASLAVPALLLALLPHAVRAVFHPDASGRPNLVVVLLDTVRHDEVGWGGSSRPTTPRLDRLAAKGRVFTQAIAQASWTKPSTGSLLTGLTPSHHLAVGRPTLNWYPDLPPERRTLAEALASAGWFTAAVSTNPNIGSAFGFTQGFFRFHEDTRLAASGAIRVAQEELSEAGKRPFFLYLHLNDAHYPYTPPPSTRGMFDRDPTPAQLDGASEARFRRGEPVFDHRDLVHLKAAHEEEIRSLDEEVGSFLSDLLSQHPNTIAVVLADHGEEFLEHGDLGHGHTLYDELLRVPLMFCWGGAVHLPSGRSDEQVRVIDVLPTLLDLLGLHWPEGAEELDGRSLLPLFEGRPDPPRPAFAETDSPGSPRSGRTGPLRAWRTPGWKLILTDPWSPQAGRSWLFDLSSDPGEHANLAAQHPRQLSDLRGALEASGWLIHKAPLVTDRAQLPEDLGASLAALGYADDVTGPDSPPSFAPGAVPWVQDPVMNKE